VIKTRGSERSDRPSEAVWTSYPFGADTYTNQVGSLPPELFNLTPRPSPEALTLPRAAAGFLSTPDPPCNRHRMQTYQRVSHQAYSLKTKRCLAGQIPTASPRTPSTSLRTPRVSRALQRHERALSTPKHCCIRSGVFNAKRKVELECDDRQTPET